MKAGLINSYRNNNSYSNKLKQGQNNAQTLKDNNAHRPAQAISFGGSVVNLGQKVIDNKAVNGLVNFVSENEAAYNAIYSLVIAGMVKPMFVLAQTGHDDKDGQVIATKNFLQAFLGSFLGLTIGGGFIKKIWDNIKNNIKLFDIDENRNLSVLDANSDRVKEIAKDVVVKEHTGFSAKIAKTKEIVENADGLKKVPEFFKGMFSKLDYSASKDEVNSKAKEIIRNFNDNHKAIFEKNPEFLKDLVSNMKEIELNPSSAKRNLKHGSQLFDAFESFWKNSTGAVTSITKAKISSFLLPSVMAFLFAKRNLENQRRKHNEDSAKASSTLLENSIAFNRNKDRFSLVAPTENKNNDISFKGKALDKAVNVTTGAIEKLAMSKPGEKAVHALSKCKKPSARMGDLESLGITTYWVGSTIMSKKIDPDQKLGLNVHSILVTAVSSTVALILDSISDGIVNKSEDAYLQRLNDVVNSAKEKLKEGADIEEIKKFVSKNTSNLFNSKKVLEKLSNKEFLNLEPKALAVELENFAAKYGKKLSKFKSLTIFTLVVRFLVPVLTVKPSKKIKNKIIEWTKERRLKKENNQNQLQENQQAK